MLNDEDFFSVYGKVPRLNVDLVIRSEKSILFVLRTIEPNAGCWHLPGGTVYKSETIKDAVIRTAKKETGLDVEYVRDLGFMEFPAEMRKGVSIHTVSIVVEIRVTGGELRHDEGAEEVKYFTLLPDPVIKEHGEFIKAHNLF